MVIWYLKMNKIRLKLSSVCIQY